jgi:general secretion pathway protein N
MIQFGFILALAFGFADLGRAEVRPLLATRPVVVAAVDTVPKPETSLGMPGALDPLGGPKAPVGLTPELRPPAPSNRRSAERAPSGNPLWAVPMSLLSVTRDRPIFSPSRRPPPAAVAGVPYVQPTPPPAPNAPGPSHPQLTLVGTVASDKEGIGVFLDRETNNIVRLRMGEGHAGWILRAVRVREVTLQNGGLTETLSLPPPGLQADVPQPDVSQASVPQSSVPQPGIPPSVHQPGAPWTSVPPNGAPDNL